jgi:hypothetical protein
MTEENKTGYLTIEEAMRQIKEALANDTHEALNTKPETPCVNRIGQANSNDRNSNEGHGRHTRGR